ncbi:hypothetical protein EPIB1_565 [Tritonibacter mobilis]|nr:hypothetical protein EPIB1_565 [Tritonibacter mobilis]
MLPVIEPRQTGTRTPKRRACAGVTGLGCTEPVSGWLQSPTSTIP